MLMAFIIIIITNTLRFHALLILLFRIHAFPHIPPYFPIFPVYSFLNFCIPSFTHSRIPAFLHSCIPAFLIPSCFHSFIPSLLSFLFCCILLLFPALPASELLLLLLCFFTFFCNSKNVSPAFPSFYNYIKGKWLQRKATLVIFE